MSATLNSIPASWIVNVTPNVLSAGGTALQLNGLFLSESWRVPVGSVLSFPTQEAVGDYFGATSDEYEYSVIYFNGFTNSNKKPGALLFAQYNLDDVGAYLRGGVVSGLTLAQLQALTGVLTLTIDGGGVTSSNIDLSAATSFSNASQIITEALGTTGPTQATATGKIGASFTAAIATTVLTVASMAGSPAGVITVGDTVVGVGVTANTTIVSFGTGTGGVGTYNVNNSQTVGSESMTVTSTKMVVSAVATGTLAVGQEVVGSGVAAGTFITAQTSGTTGGVGNYTISDKQTAASTALTMVQPTVTYDSQSGAFLVVSGTDGASSTIGYGSGTIAASLALTAATGAVTSRGADAIASGDAATAMNAIAAQTQNWATFLFIGVLDESGFANRLALAAWVNGTNDRYVFVCGDTDITPTASSAATSSLGYAIISANYSGTHLVWQPAANDTPYTAFASGVAASVDFDETNGRITEAFKGQSGLEAAVTSQTIADNLIANGYNFYSAVAPANDRFLFMYPGSISGDFLWFDTFIDQIQLNNALQLALLVLLTQAKRVAYNPAGRALIQAACMDPIMAALNFGSITPGVTLSASQIAQVNSAAGVPIDRVLSTRGWFLQVLDATPQVRAARGSPPVTLWYMDGGAVQRINLTSVAVL